MVQYELFVDGLDSSLANNELQRTFLYSTVGTLLFFSSASPNFECEHELKKPVVLHKRVARTRQDFRDSRGLPLPLPSNAAASLNPPAISVDVSNPVFLTVATHTVPRGHNMY
jgi:hypothetical protein